MASVTVDLSAGDCLLDCGPALLNFSSLHNQIIRCLGCPGMKILNPFSGPFSGPFHVLVTSLE